MKKLAHAEKKEEHTVQVCIYTVARHFNTPAFKNPGSTLLECKKGK